jgi:hypothetical protein
VEFDLGLGPESDLELVVQREPVPTISRTEWPQRPKLPGISSRFLLEMHLPADGGQFRCIQLGCVQQAIEYTVCHTGATFDRIAGTGCGKAVEKKTPEKMALKKDD